MPITDDLLNLIRKNASKEELERLDGSINNSEPIIFTHQILYNLISQETFVGRRGKTNALKAIFFQYKGELHEILDRYSPDLIGEIRIKTDDLKEIITNKFAGEKAVEELTKQMAASSIAAPRTPARAMGSSSESDSTHTSPGQDSSPGSLGKSSGDESGGSRRSGSSTDSSVKISNMPITVAMSYQNRKLAIGVSGERVKGNVADRNKGERGEGDHVTPYSIFVDIIYAAVDGEPSRTVADIICDIASVFLNEEELAEMNAYAAQYRTELEADRLSREERRDFIRALREQGHDEVMLNKVEASLKESEKLRTVGLISDLGTKLISYLNLGENVSFAKSRVMKQRKDRMHKTEIAIREQLGLPPTEKITKEHRDNALKSIRLSDVYQVSDLSLQQDIEYYNRVKGEGTRVKMALRDLRALNKFVALQREDVSPRKKESILEEIKTHRDGNNSLDLRKGLESYGIEITDETSLEDIQAINMNSPEIAKRIGKLFGNLFDFERVDYKNTEQNDKELDKLYELTSKHTLLMFKAFKHFDSDVITPESKSLIFDNLLNNIVVKQGWNRAEIQDFNENGIPSRVRLDTIKLKGKILEYTEEVGLNVRLVPFIGGNLEMEGKQL